MEEWDMENSKSVSSPGVSEEKANLEAKKMEEEVLDEKESTTYRRAAARIIFMALTEVICHSLRKKLVVEWQNQLEAT